MTFGVLLFFLLNEFIPIHIISYSVDPIMHMRSLVREMVSHFDEVVGRSLYLECPFFITENVVGLGVALNEEILVVVRGRCHDLDSGVCGENDGPEGEGERADGDD